MSRRAQRAGPEAGPGAGQGAGPGARAEAAAGDGAGNSLLRKVENSYMMLLKDELLKQSFTIVTLPEPATGSPSKYCLDHANNKIYEIVVYDEPHRSWFIDEMVKSDGRLHFTTPINPTFLILPRLKQECTNRAVPLEDLLSEKGFDQILDFIPSLEHVADLKGPAEMKAYKYNEEKTTAWLAARVKKLAKVLRDKNIHVTSGAVSATFITSTKGNDHIDEEFYLKFAHGIIADKLPEDIADAVEKHFNFNPEIIESLSKKRKSEAENDPDKKKVKIEHIEEQKENSVTGPNQSSDISIKAAKPATLTNKEKARQKAASGTKTISSFFTKKSK